MEVKNGKGDVETAGNHGNSVLLFRAPREAEGNDPFESEIRQRGFMVHSIPVLDFNFINLPELSDCFREVQNYSAVVFTSPRSVEAVKIASTTFHEPVLHNSGDRSWEDLLCYVVGKGTHNEAETLGFKPLEREAGNAEILSDSIIEDFKSTPEKFSKPVLYPCGNLKRDTLANKLQTASLQLKILTVYETVPNKDLERKFKELVQLHGLPEYVVYFSPSGVKNTEHLVKDGSLPLEDMKVVAIGPTTMEALRSKNIKLYGVARTPDAAGILDVIRK